MDLRHIVITSVDRDDLRDDYGATIWAETIQRLNSVVPNCSVEVLTPDFGHMSQHFRKFLMQDLLYFLIILNA